VLCAQRRLQRSEIRDGSEGRSDCARAVRASFCLRNEAVVVDVGAAGWPTPTSTGFSYAESTQLQSDKLFVVLAAYHAFA
jgi:hypothetical protein